MTARPGWIGWLVGTPAVAMIALVGLLAIASLAGHDLLWRQPADMSLPELTALKDTAGVTLRLEAGADPNAPGAVVHAFRLDHPVVATPLEAATAADRADMVPILVAHGARLDEPTLTRLRCFAQRLKNRDVAGVLARYDARPLDCANVASPW